MNTFVKGVLEVNKDGATYENVVYDRRLTLRLTNGERLYIFDFTEPISTSLQVNEVYEMVVVPFVVKVELASEFRSEVATEFPLWQGKVIDPHWQAVEGTFHLAQPDLYDGEWTLVDTPFGQMLLSAENIETTFHTGEIVQWEQGRQDLYAMV